MRRTALPIAIVTSIILSVVAGCGKQALISNSNVDEYGDRVVAAIGDDYALTLPSFYDSLEQRRNLLPRGGILDTAQQAIVLDSILVDTLAWLEAHNVDVSRHYRHYRLAKRRYEEVLIRTFFDREVYDKIPMDSNLVAEYYRENAELFEREEQVLAYHILVTIMGARTGEDSARFDGIFGQRLELAIEEYVHEIREVLDTAESFEEVALRYSTDNTVRADRGLLGWVTRGEYIDPFDSIVFALEPGEISEPYQDPAGWHIIKVVDRVEAGLPELDSTTWPVAMNTYQTAHANTMAREIVDSLRQHIEMTYNEPMLDSNAFLVAGSTWAAIVNDEDTLFFDDVRTFEEGYRQQFNIPNSTAEMKKDGLRRMADRSMLVMAAKDRGIDEVAEVQEARRRVFQEHGREILSTQMRDPRWQPTDSMIAAYYEANADEFVVRKPLVVQQIIVEDSLLGEFIRDQALAGVDFIDLAEEYYPGEPSMRRELADLGAVGQDEVSPLFWQTALATPIGSVSHPVKTDLGYQVIKVLEVKKSKSLEDASIVIRQRLKQQRNRAVWTDFRDRMYEKYEVRFPNELKPVHLRPTEQRIEN